MIYKKKFRWVDTMPTALATAAFDINTELWNNSGAFFNFAALFTQYRVRRVSLLYMPKWRYHLNPSTSTESPLQPNTPLLLNWSLYPTSFVTADLIEDEYTKVGSSSDPMRYTCDVFSAVTDGGTSVLWANSQDNSSTPVTNLFGGWSISGYQFDNITPTSQSTVTVEVDVEFRESN